MTKPELSTLLHLSTAHITENTANLLNGENNIFMAKHEYGWFVWVSDEPEANPDIPPDIFAIMKYAHKLGCRWVCLDCDAPTIDELPKYEW